MEIQYILLFALLTLVAEILGTIGGFGSSVFFVPLASYFFDFYSVLGITVVFHLISNISKIALFRTSINRRLFFTIGLPSILFVILGALITPMVNTRILRIALGIFLIFLSLFLLVKKDFSLKPTPFNAIGGGSIAGFLAGLVGTGGALRGITLTSFNLEKHIFIATSAAIDLGVDAARSLVYMANGFIKQEHLYLIPLLILAASGGTWIGKKALEKIAQEHFRRIVLLLILGIGIASLREIFISNT